VRYEDFLRRNFRPVDEAQMKIRWKTHYDHALEHCQHGGTCQTSACLTGNRVRLQPFLAGCILPLWDSLKAIQGERQSKTVKICRVRINDGDMRGQRLVGIKIDSRSFTSFLSRQPDPKPDVKVTKLTFDGQPLDGQLSRQNVASPMREHRTRAANAAAARSSLPKRVTQDGDSDGDDLVVLPVEPEPPRNSARSRRTIVVMEDDPPDI
jgi:hypothetical protein